MTVIKEILLKDGYTFSYYNRVADISDSDGKILFAVFCDGTITSTLDNLLGKLDHFGSFPNGLHPQYLKDLKLSISLLEGANQ